MTAQDSGARVDEVVEEVIVAEAPTTGPLAGDPAMLGLPSLIVMLTLATLRLPLAFTAVFALIDVALLLLFINTIHASAGLSKTAGYVVLAFAALGVYVFFGSASMATGGKQLPLGRPVLGNAG